MMRVLESYAELSLLASLNGMEIAEYVKRLSSESTNILDYGTDAWDLWGIIRPDGVFEWFGPKGSIPESPGVVRTVGLAEGYVVRTIGCRHVTIPDGVKYISNNAFNDCDELTGVTMPNSVENIGSYAFAGCSRLTSATIPSSVTSVGPGAFDGCSGLTSATIPDSVTSIGECAFVDCCRLNRVGFQGRTIGEVVNMPEYPWGIESDRIRTSR